MPVSSPKTAHDTLRARDAQTVITPGIDVGPADDAKLNQEATARQAAEKASSAQRWGFALVALGIVVLAALAFFVL